MHRHACRCICGDQRRISGDLLYHTPSYFFETEHQPELVARLVASKLRDPPVSLGLQRTTVMPCFLTWALGIQTQFFTASAFPLSPDHFVFIKCKPSYVKMDTSYSVVATHSGRALRRDSGKLQG